MSSFEYVLSKIKSENVFHKISTKKSTSYGQNMQSRIKFISIDRKTMAD